MPISREEVFGRLVKASKGGTFPGWDPLVGCRYLTAEGRMCAFGVFIPDGHPAQKLTGQSAKMVLSEYPDLEALLVGPVSQNDWLNIQDAHDTVANKYKTWPHDTFVDELAKRFPADEPLIRSL